MTVKMDRIRAITRDMHDIRENMNKRIVCRNREVDQIPLIEGQIRSLRLKMADSLNAIETYTKTRRDEKDHYHKIQIENAAYYVNRARIQLFEADIERIGYIVCLVSRENDYDRACLREMSVMLERIRDEI